MKAVTLLIVLVFVLTYHDIPAQEKNKISSDQKLELSQKIVSGQLDNGLKYFIRQNKKPEKRAELRLVVNAGAILEEDDQNGLAHFTEHMGFNGTKNFKKHELIDFLESIGMKFGPEVNAYTDVDETVYMLQVPTDTPKIFEKGFEVLRDWAQNVTFEDEEIDKERGVIIEEWRLGRGAFDRMWDKQAPVIFKDSKYAERNVIGTKEILESFPYERIKQFYKDWYRPDLMAVIAVGDFDVKETENIIKKHFSEIPAPDDARIREYFNIPDHKETLFAIASDKENFRSSVSVYYKKEIEPEETVGEYRRNLLYSLYNQMFNQRLQEITMQADPPFISAFSGNFDLVRTKAAYALSAQVKENGIEQGLAALLTEANRVKQFGFTETELERAKKNVLRWMERSYNERDKSESVGYANELVRHFLQKEPAPGIEFEYDMYKQFIPGIKLEEINGLISKLIRDENIVVLANSPEKEGLRIPTEDDLKKVFENAQNEKVTAYVDKTGSEDLFNFSPRPAEVVSENKMDDINITELKLANGVTVVLKPTDFKNDEILFASFSSGGSSLVSDDEYISAQAAGAIVNQSGLGNVNLIELQKVMAGKIVNVSPWISLLQEGINGRTSPADVETMFKMIHLYFTSPRADSTAFQSYLLKNRTYLQNKSVYPEWAFQDTIQNVMSNYHERSKPWSVETLNEIDMNEALKIYKDRFADAGDFTFIFVGNFETEKMKELARTYLGTLPTIKRNESWKDLNIEPPDGIVKKAVYKGIEPKSQVFINFNGELDWSSENIYNLRAFTDAMQIKLREVVREEKSGTYGIGISNNASKYPKQKFNIYINFGCDPGRVDELVETVFMQLDSVQQYGISDTYVHKVKEQHLRSRETDLKKNETWLNSLRGSYTYGQDPHEIIEYEKLIQKISKEQIQQAARKYIDKNNYIQIVLYPEPNKSN